MSLELSNKAIAIIKDADNANPLDKNSAFAIADAVMASHLDGDLQDSPYEAAKMAALATLRLCRRGQL